MSAGGDTSLFVAIPVIASLLLVLFGLFRCAKWSDETTAAARIERVELCQQLCAPVGGMSHLIGRTPRWCVCRDATQVRVP